MNSTLVTVLNLILSAGIFVLALFAWSRLRSTLALFVGIAFGLFAVSHLVLVFGLGEAAQGLIVVVRVLGYALVLIALYKEMLAKREPPGGAKPR